jgi:hypothetical protein
LTPSGILSPPPRRGTESTRSPPMPPTRARRPRTVAVLALVAALAAFPLASLASDTFADVPDSNVFHNDINAIADAGVTTGCGGGNYCPSANVTREQMAAFMNRLGALSAGKTPVVNADKLDGLDSTDFMPSGDVTMVELGNWSSLDPNTSVIQFGNEINLNATASQTSSFFTQLHGPIGIGYQPYALKQVVVCAGGYNNVTNMVYLIVSQGSDTLVQNLSPDNPPVDGLCYTLDISTPVYSATYVPLLNVATSAISSGYVSIRMVRTVWTPIPIPPG